MLKLNSMLSFCYCEVLSIFVDEFLVHFNWLNSTASVEPKLSSNK